MVGKMIHQAISSIDSINDTLGTIVYQCQTNIVYQHNVVQIGSCKKTYCDAKPIFRIDKIRTCLYIPLSSTFWEEYLIQSWFKDGMQFVKRKFCHPVDAPEKVIGQLRTNFLLEPFPISLDLFAFASILTIRKK